MSARVAVAQIPATLLRARVALALLTTIWGSTFVVIEAGLGGASPFVLVAARFALASLVLALWRPRALGPALRATVAALPLTVSMVAGFGLQTFGLQTTTPARSAFLTSLMVVFVPAFELIRMRRLPRPRLLVAVAVAALGVFALFHPVALEWRLGDTLTLLSAIIFGYYVVALSRLAQLHDVTVLTLAQTLGIAVMAVPCALVFDTITFDFAPGTLLVVAYLGIVCSAFTFTVMTRAQAIVPAVEASVIYTLEPVSAALLSLALARDVWRWQLAAGGSLVVIATLVAATSSPEAPPRHDSHR